MRKYFVLIVVALLLVSGGIAAGALASQKPVVKQQRASPLLLLVRSMIANLGGGCGGGCGGGGGGGGCHGNVTNVTGVLAYDGEVFTLGEYSLKLGCWSYLNTTALYDFDGDGTVETNFAEVSGLVGSTVTMGGYLCGCQQSRLMVYTINGLEYREGCGGSASWKGFWG
jgi:hypothetical protein